MRNSYVFQLIDLDFVLDLGKVFEEMRVCVNDKTTVKFQMEICLSFLNQPLLKMRHERKLLINVELQNILLVHFFYLLMT